MHPDDGSAFYDTIVTGHINGRYYCPHNKSTASARTTSTTVLICILILEKRIQMDIKQTNFKLEITVKVPRAIDLVCAIRDVSASTIGCQAKYSTE